MNIRGKTISYSSFEKKLENNRAEYLLNEIQRVENYYSENNHLVGDYLHVLEKGLFDLREHGLKGNVIISRVAWIEEGETPLLISHVTNGCGEHIFDNCRVQREGCNFYKLSNFESDSLEGPLLYAEVYIVLKNMKNNKSPGPDGFTIEFYKFFWKDVDVF